MSEQPETQLPSKLIDSNSRFRLGSLVYVHDDQGRLLLMQRERRPNVGLWCAVGGKLKMSIGESPYECAVREVREEAGIDLECPDLDLRCILSEKDYVDTGNWLMFVFRVNRAFASLPVAGEEGVFKLFEMDDIDGIAMPALDKRILRDYILPSQVERFASLRVSEGGGLDPDKLVVEESFPSKRVDDSTSR